MRGKAAYLKKKARLIEHFVAGTAARAESEIVGVQATRLYASTCGLVSWSPIAFPAMNSQKRLKQMRAILRWGAQRQARQEVQAGKIAVFDLLKWGGKVYAAIIPYTPKRRHSCQSLRWRCNQKVRCTLMPSSCNALDESDFHHRPINHSTLFEKERNHIIRIEDFWKQAKLHLRRFNGIKPDSFYW